MTRHLKTAGIAVFGAALLQGCLHSPVADHWGDAVAEATAAQTVDVHAGPKTAVPEGLDARTARHVAERYHRSQQQQRTRQARAVVLGDL